MPNELQYSQGKKKQDESSGEKKVKNPKSYDEFAESREKINVVDLTPDDLGVTDEFIRENYDVDDLKLTGIDPSVKQIKKEQKKEIHSDLTEQQLTKEAQEGLKKLEEELTKPDVHPNDKYRIVNDETSRTIYVGNISLTTIEDDLGDLFKQFGNIEKIKIAKSKQQGVKGYAHIVFKDIQGSQKALSAKDNNVILDGKKLQISQARGMQPKNMCINCGSSTHQTIECPQGNAGKNCFLCGKYGHVSRHCPKNYSRTKIARCFKCGKEGHTLYNCPQNQTR